MSIIDKVKFGSQTLEIVDNEARSQVANKVDKEEGKTLTANDLTNELKTNYDAAYEHISNTNNPHNITPEDIGAAKNNHNHDSVYVKNAYNTIYVDDEQMSTANGSDNLEFESGDGIDLSIGSPNNAEFSVKINNAGVRSISTGTTDGTVSVNTNGTTSDVAIKGFENMATKKYVDDNKVSVDGLATIAYVDNKIKTGKVVFEGEYTDSAVEDTTFNGIFAYEIDKPINLTDSESDFDFYITIGRTSTENLFTFTPDMFTLGANNIFTANVNNDQYSGSIDFGIDSSNNKIVLTYDGISSTTSIGFSYMKITDGPMLNELTDGLKYKYDTAYTHSKSTHAPANAQKNSDITKAEIEAKLTGDVTTHTHAQYLTEHQDLSEYAKTADLPSVEGFAPKDSPVFTNNISMGRRENSTTGSYSVAVGAELQASGMFSHAEGYWAIASNDASHAEGYGTTASGSSSHAEGTNSVASGSSSHAEGSHTQASGGCSHTEGIYTIASSDYQHVEGKYNVEDTINKYAHIVGNGSDENARSNAHTLDWNGNAWYAGNVSINGNPTKNNNLVTKEYADNKLLNITTYLDEDITDSTSTITYKDNYSAYTFDKIDIASVINNLKLEVKVENNLSSNIVDSVIIFKDFVYDSTLEAYSAYFSTEENTDQEDKVYITNDDTKTIIVYSTEFTFYGLWKHIKLYKTEDKYANKTDIHTHSNKEVLDGITAEKVAQWDSNTGSGGGTTSGINIVTISQSDYDALETKDPNTLYLITTTNAGEIDTASNDITLSDDLPAGTYTLKYEDENNQPLEGFDEITTMEVQ